jgi:hypothetical protein
MGIRVHKDLGYGVDNIKYKKEKHSASMDDPRIDREKFCDLREKASDLEGAKLLRWVEKEKEGLLDFHIKHNPFRIENPKEHVEFDIKMIRHQFERMAKDKKHTDLGRGIVYEDEFGLPNVLLFTPITCPEWRRYDDIIDYCEETYKKDDGCVANYKFLRSSGIYPWNGRMVRFRDPKPGVLKEGAKKDDLRFIDASTYSQLVGYWDPKLEPLAKGDALKHFQEDYRPAFPIDLMMLLWFMKDAFKDVDSFVNELRPMIYVHWG